jgi:hypothetical protein
MSVQKRVVVAAKIAVAGNSSAGDVADAIDAAEMSVRRAVPGPHPLIYLEPDIDSAHIAALPPPCHAQDASYSGLDRTASLLGLLADRPWVGSILGQTVESSTRLPQLSARAEMTP